MLVGQEIVVILVKINFIKLVYIIDYDFNKLSQIQVLSKDLKNRISIYKRYILVLVNAKI